MKITRTVTIPAETGPDWQVTASIHGDGYHVRVGPSWFIITDDLYAALGDAFDIIDGKDNDD